MITLKDQIAEIEREIAIRRGVYPKWVASGKMKQEAAERQIGRLLAVRDTLQSVERSEAAINAKPEAAT